MGHGGGSIVLAMGVVMKGVVLIVVHRAARITSQASEASIVIAMAIAKRAES